MANGCTCAELNLECVVRGYPSSKYVLLSTMEETLTFEPEQIQSK